ncbi:M18 family aminopeptidase [Actinomyces qiguomingii]|uniref:M18 family aminopeptidase n=1 Tax=Actinomyces qiguomingii TaxID=2057800 RepID=UPI000CA01B30|nr:M18 family aminopeptidase [Actinomyces qiguomingii]
MTDPETPALYGDDAYADSIIDFITASPTSYHTAAEVARRLDAVGMTEVDECKPWGADLPRRGYMLRDGAVIAWLLPARLEAGAGLRIIGAHTDSPALRLKPSAAIERDGVQLLNVEVYGGPLLNSFLDRELGLAGRLVTRSGATRLVRTGPIARVAQVAPHLDRSVNESLHLDRQAHLLPLWTLVGAGHHDVNTRPASDAPERYLCEQAGIDPADLAFADILTYPTEPPARFGLHGEFLASSRLDNLSSVHAALVALESLAREGADGEPKAPIIFVANDHEEVGSGTRSGAAGPLLQTALERLARSMGVADDAYAALLAHSVCLSADAGHAAHPNHPQLHDPAVRPVLGGGPLLKINAQQRYATDAAAVAAWVRACRAAGVPSQDFVSNNAVPCGTTIGPITATRLGVSTVDVGQGLLSMHSQREMCAVADGPLLARAMRSYWLSA